MEWIIEGVFLIFLGILTIATAAIDRDLELSKVVFGLIAAVLNVLSVVSLFTGFKINFIPFKLCPVIFTGSSMLILLGTLL